MMKLGKSKNNKDQLFQQFISNEKFQSDYHQLQCIRSDHVTIRVYPSTSTILITFVK